MYSLRIFLLMTCLFISTSSFATLDSECKAYSAACMSNAAVKNATNKKERWDAVRTCITAAAKGDTAKGQACLTAQAKREAQHK